MDLENMINMDSKDVASYLKTIHDMIVLDEDIVTYKQLSATLNIHTNVAKKLLFTFITSKSYEGLKLLVTYLIAGILPDKKGFCVTVVNRDEVEKMKCKLEVVTSQHVYSVQTKQNSVSLNTLYLKALDASIELGSRNNLSSIQCTLDVVKTDSQISELRKVAYGCDTRHATQLNTEESNILKSGSKTTKKASLSKSVESLQIDKPDVQMKDSTTRVENLSNNENVDVVNKKQYVPTLGQSIKSNKKGVNSKNSKKGHSNTKHTPALSSFFNRVNSVKQSESTVAILPKPLEPSDIKTTNTNSEISTTNNSSLKNELVVENKIKKDLKSCATNGVSNQKTAVKRSKNKMQKKVMKQDDKKKRKRILLPSSSESSDDEESECEEPILNEPEPEVTPAEPSEDEDLVPATPEPSKKRKRRLVNKTYTDDEGYVLTKKEYAYESASDSEDVPEEPPKKEIKTNTSIEAQPVKVSSPKKTKQANIMNFFSKSR